MTRPWRPLALGWAALSIALYVVAGVLGSQVPSEDFLDGAVRGTSTLLLTLIGAAIALRRPRHKLGWLLMVAGSGELLAGTCIVYGAYLTDAGAHLPYATQVSWIGGSMWAFSAAALLILLPLYFPTGRPPTPRWRWVGWIGGAGVVALFLGTLDVLVFLPHLMDARWEVIEAASAGRPLFIISEAAFPLMMAAGPVALLSLIVRFVRSTGEERQQIKLLIYAVTMTLVFLLATNLTEGIPRTVEVVATGLAIPSVGVATMIAVLRYRLFEIDRVVSRTLAYALLTVLLVGIYVLAVSALTTITTSRTGDSPIAVAAATLLAAAAFQPARRRIQTAVDQRFNRARYDARRTVEHFASTLRQEVDIDDVRSQLVGTVDTVLSPSAVRVWVRPGGNA